ncbi:uncharacterized protein ACOB8E_012343 [Sarcophilus harrisii]
MSGPQVFLKDKITALEAAFPPKVVLSSVPPQVSSGMQISAAWASEGENQHDWFRITGVLAVPVFYKQEHQEHEPQTKGGNFQTQAGTPKPASSHSLTHNFILKLALYLT